MSHFPDLNASTRSVGSSLKTYPQFLLFGDSITQGSSHVFHSSLSEWYSRRLDVLIRGFSGYTAPVGYDTLLQFFPAVPPSDVVPRIRLMTVFFGANDACLAGTPQHVPIGEYKQYLRNIVNYEGVKLHQTNVVLIVPAPVDEWQLATGERKAATTAKYASACREVGQELNLPILDLWTIFMLKAGWKEGSTDALIGSKAAPQNQVLGELLSDGLHFTPAAYRLVFEELVKIIQNELPDQVPENLPFVFPDWRTKLGAEMWR
ncbi:uncharacterized protein Z518_07449 [Rhinocladiella mackenziei CBS 650.93]|uniref:SGNH hydrolase-type esterase domain-containing protein n=1 Tax=Rhinocladiella mackenziei CBS 650.93 TaxID=1442369 RepID=A0A0D2IL13_9EURO|nr:uncharacterized protein Z518_07449 [Rhinocladiella mackenziei CBS 650.93]KIX03896.1 hypothetical protein Z518_07449 [Rhinocladiella mackenziei CBS 650.93]